MPNVIMNNKKGSIWSSFVDQGGGGTIAYILAQYNMEVIDCIILSNRISWKQF